MTLSALSRRVPITPNTQIKDVPWPDNTVRILNGLEQAGIQTIGELCQLSESDLRRVRRIGKGSIDTIKAVLHSAGLSLVTHCPRCGAPVNAFGRYQHQGC